MYGVIRPADMSHWDAVRMPASFRRASNGRWAPLSNSALRTGCVPTPPRQSAGFDPWVSTAQSSAATVRLRWLLRRVA